MTSNVLNRSRRGSGRLVIVALGAVVVLAVAWWLLTPLFLDREVNEAFPLAASAEIPATMDRRDVEREMTAAAAGIDQAEEAPPPGMPQAPALGKGTFVGADDFHQGSGRAAIYELPDGGRLLRLEEFEVTNGPDLHVILTPTAQPTGREDVSVEGYVDLGGLKGNVGDQNYPIPDGVDVGAQHSVVIYCLPFHVVFATATLQS